MSHPLPASLRFEVFKRDRFTCQYCGAAAPAVVLQVDHIDPVANGGPDDLINLVTSCRPCNGGKGARLLTDDSVLVRQREQLLQLADRREQLLMLAQWRNVLLDTQDLELALLLAAYRVAYPGWELNEQGVREAQKRVRQHGIRHVLDTLLEVSVDVVPDARGRATAESVRITWKRFHQTLAWEDLKKTNPIKADMMYIRGIVRNRVIFCDNRACLQILMDAAAAGVPSSRLQALALQITGWNEWRDGVARLVEGAKNGVLSSGSGPVGRP